MRKKLPELLKHASDIIFKSRLRIILLVALSLVSSVSYIVPDNICLGYLHESLLNEHENPDGCKVSLGMETTMRGKRASSQRQFHTSSATTLQNTGVAAYAPQVSWARPAYYVLLHLFSLF